MTAANTPQPPATTPAEPPEPPIVQVTASGDGMWQARMPARAWLAAISEPAPELSDSLGRFLALANVTHPDAHLITAWMYAHQQGGESARADRDRAQVSPVRIEGLDGSGPLFIASGTGPTLLDPGLGYLVLSVNHTGDVYLVAFADGDGLPTGEPPEVRLITAHEPDIVLRFQQATGRCTAGHVWHCRPDPYGYPALYRTANGADDGAEHVLSRYIVAPTGDSGGYIACPTAGCGHPVALAAITG